MKIKVEKVVEFRLHFKYDELLGLYKKLRDYHNTLPLESWSSEKDGVFYMTKTPTDEVEEFLFDLHIFFKNDGV